MNPKHEFEIYGVDNMWNKETRRSCKVWVRKSHHGPLR